MGGGEGRVFSPLKSPSPSTVSTTFSIFTGRGFLNFTVALDVVPIVSLAGAMTSNVGGSGAMDTSFENTCPASCTARYTVNLKYTCQRVTVSLQRIRNSTLTNLIARVLAENAALYCHGNSLSLALVYFLVHF